MDYFLIEAVNALRASSAVAAARAKKVEQEMIEAGLIPPPAPVLPPLKDAQRDSVGSNVSKDSTRKISPDEEDEVRVRLEAIGMHVGANVTERSVCLSGHLLVEFMHSGLSTLDCVTTAQCSQTPWMLLSSYVRISGLHVGINRWTICVQITVYVDPLEQDYSPYQFAGNLCST